MRSNHLRNEENIQEKYKTEQTKKTIKPKKK